MLSGENTPTLCYAIPAFTSFINIWQNLSADNPAWEDIIEPGLDKLKDYQERVTDVYDLAMGEIKFNLILYHWVNINIAIDPANKLSFYRENEQPEKYESAKKKFLQAVRQLLFMNYVILIFL